MSKISDKDIEKNRYDKIAHKKIKLLDVDTNNKNYFGQDTVKESLRDPYMLYEDSVRAMLSPGTNCLELGSGDGRFTRLLLESGSDVHCLDISKISNKINQKKNKSYKNLTTHEGDIERMPFPDNHFDFIVNAGSLSYGKKILVKNEILRILKDGGCFMAVDSLNNSPIYKFNRFIRYLLRNRSKMTLVNMWNINDLNQFSKYFESSEVQFFGIISWIEPILSRFMGKEKFISLSRRVDKISYLNFLSFKFVFIGKKLIQKNKDSYR